MGVVGQVRFCNKCIDSDLIRRSSTGAQYIFDVWGSPSGTSYEERGSCFPQAGDFVTSDGAFSEEMNGLTVDAVNQNVTFSDGINTVELTNVDATLQAGDSGGPWFQHIGSTNGVCIVGTEVGGTSGSQYYEQIGGIDSFFAVHVP